MYQQNFGWKHNDFLQILKKKINEETKLLIMQWAMLRLKDQEQLVADGNILSSESECEMLVSKARTYTQDK